jgi:2-polyprenyl-6-methoxyphenol hydroxylase-like FAD-dependent oxidoreductase
VLNSYIIPTDDGKVEPGHRLLNWCWFFNVDENSPDMVRIFTDVHGKRHQSTISQGLVKPELWTAQLSSFVNNMVPHVAELLSKTSIENLFVTKMNDCLCTTPSFYDGRVVLVGDAFAGLRPHTGAGTDQAARHILELDRVWQGYCTQEQWDREMVLYSQRNMKASRLMGAMEQGTFLEAICAFLGYIWFLFSLRFLS